MYNYLMILILSFMSVSITAHAGEETRTMPISIVPAHSGAAVSHYYWLKYPERYRDTEYKSERVKGVWIISPKFLKTFCLLNPKFFPRGCTEEAFTRLPAGTDWSFPLSEKMRGKTKYSQVIPVMNTTSASLVRNEPKKVSAPSPSVEVLQVENERLKEKIADLEFQLLAAEIKGRKEGRKDVIKELGVKQQGLTDLQPMMARPAVFTTLFDSEGNIVQTALDAHDMEQERDFYRAWMWVFVVLFAIAVVSLVYLRSRAKRLRDALVLELSGDGKARSKLTYRSPR